ncbi:Cof-type HAD-IIB family hydrolase [Peptacetobacter hiranonis]|uniref:Cof-type HAD-IIB family hydrolase n=1 Tax=Peptacetobacter hiranonis TaxID=89152 RepID=UPI002E7650E7|nr:Cof-type HAD-IIB family hydrolase [Peptacetobacter hiranonis]MEE0247244.1 Cof-type HAD-IIB family hydrolase [Peptacetobacter hiranonis]
MKKAAFFDVDGTLIDCTIGIMDISDRVKKAIKDFQKAGNVAFVSSGRPYAFLNKELLEFGFDGFVLGNGAQVLINDETKFFSGIDKELVKEVVSNCERLNIDYCLQGPKYSYLKKEFTRLVSYYREYGITDDFLEYNFDIDDVDVFKIEMLPVDEEGCKYCESLDQGEFNCFKNYPGEVYEMYPVKNSKGEGLLKTIELEGVELKDSYAFGDGRNDIEMIQTAAHGIAMGNAVPELKEVANEFTDAIADDGIATYLEKIL